MFQNAWARLLFLAFSCQLPSLCGEPADGQWLSRMLEDPLVGGGHITDRLNGRFQQIQLFVSSEFRDVGDRLLAQWDGKWPDDRKPLPDFRGPNEAGEDYIYL